MLKSRFNVQHINYVIDNGVIQNSWLITTEEAIDEAVALIQKQHAPIYIMGEFANAEIHWNVQRTSLAGSLWRSGNQVDSLSCVTDFDAIKKKLIDWYQQCMSRAGSDL